MINPKLSIIIPVYNIENYLARCLDSILNQTFTDFEVIIVDDGTKDNSGIIADLYSEKDNRIKVIHKENGGVSTARFEGIKIAKGEYIGFVDGDDMIDPDMYSILIANAEKYNADISHCGYKMVFPDGRIDYYYNTNKFVVQDNQNGLTDLLKGEFIEPGLWNKVYKTDFVKNVVLNKIMDSSIRINEDLLMNYYLFKQANKSVFIDKCLYHYMIHKNSAATSKININKLCDPIKVLQILDSETKNDIVLNKIVNARYARLLVYTATLSKKINPELIIPERKKARINLRKDLCYILKNEYVGSKLKLMCIWTAISPQTYSLLHNIYAKITGVDKKYSVE